MTTDITEKITNCPTCQIDAPKQQKETLQNHAILKDPWTKVDIDLFEYKDTHYMVVVDYTTDYMESEHITNL